MDLKDGLLVWNDDERDTSDIYSIYKRGINEFDDEYEYIPIYKIIKEFYDEERDALYNHNFDYDSEYYLKYDNGEYFNDYLYNDEQDNDIYSDDYYINDDLNENSSAKYELESNNEIYDKLIYDKFYYY